MRRHHSKLLGLVLILLAGSAWATNDKGGTLHLFDRGPYTSPNADDWGPQIGEWHSWLWLRTTYAWAGVPNKLYERNPDLTVCVYMNQYDVPLDQKYNGNPTPGRPSKPQYGKYKESWFMHTEYHCDGQRCTSPECDGENCIAGARISTYGTHYNGQGGTPARGDCNPQNPGTGNEDVDPEFGPCATIAPVCQDGVTQCATDADCPGLDVHGEPDYCRNMAGNDGLLNPQSCNCWFLSDLSNPEVQAFWAKSAEDVVNGHIEAEYGDTGWTGECSTNGKYPTEPWNTQDCTENLPCTGEGETCVGFGGYGTDSRGAQCIYLDNTGTNYSYTQGPYGAGRLHSGQPWGIWLQGDDKHGITYDELIEMRKQSVGAMQQQIQQADPDAYVVFNGCHDDTDQFVESGAEILSVAGGCSMEQYTIWSSCNIRYNGNGQWERSIAWYERTQAMGKVFVPLAGEECMYDPHTNWDIGDASDNRDPTNLDEYAAASALLGCYPDTMETCAVSYWTASAKSAADGTIDQRYCLNPSHAGLESSQRPCTSNADCPSGWECSQGTKYAFHDMDLGLPVTTKTCSDDPTDYCAVDSDCPGSGATCTGFNWQWVSGVAAREYTQGLVLVNPDSGADRTYILPAGRSYVDKFGDLVQGGVTLPGGFGRILRCTNCDGGQPVPLPGVPNLHRTDQR